MKVASRTISLAVTDPKGQVTTRTVNTTIVGDVPMSGPALVVGANRISINFDQTTGVVTKTIPIRNAGTGGALLWQASSDNPRVTMAAPYGVTPVDLAIQVNTAGLLAEARFTARVTLTSPGISPVVVTVDATSIERALMIDRASLDFGSQTIGATSPALQIKIAYRGAGTLPLGAMSLSGASSSEFSITADNCERSDS